LGKRKNSDGASNNLEIVEAPCSLPSDAASVHFAAVMTTLRGNPPHVQFL
jgi:hypothetical protein